MNQRILVLGALLLGLVGCAHQQTRLQAEDETEKEKVPEIKTIGDMTTVANAESLPVTGVGLVVNLDGTGSSAPPGVYRTMLENQLHKNKVPMEHVKEVLASPSTSLVLVTALIPPGARKDDPLDVEITLPRESRTTSLRGGRLLECPLLNFENKRNIDKVFAPSTQGGDQFIPGHKVARAEGQLLVGLGDGDDSGKMRQARIWGGGRSLMDRPFYLALNSDQQFGRVAQAVAARINETFHGAFQGDMAAARDKFSIALNVPAQYKLNLPRYLRVVRLIPLMEAPAERLPYRKHLAAQLLDPAHAVTAALRLEALGDESIPALKHGLTSDHALVRFCSAEALAYLNCPSCGEELARIVKEQPVLRAFSLTALASLNEAVSHVELRKLLEDTAPETRYGAFRALRTLDEHEESIHGEQLDHTFWLHRVAPGSPALVHLSVRNRAEIVLFGDDISLIPPFPILAGDFTITAGREDDHCTISHISTRTGSRQRQCSLKLEEVLHAMAEMGASYPEVVELLHRADRLQCLSCKVAVDALPQLTTVYDLSKAGTDDPELLQTPQEVLDAKGDFNATPTLFDKGNTRLGQ